MPSESKLAIVIPAFKLAFFEQAIRSVAAQTCKAFTLYIGDDASPYALEDVVASYRDKISIVYKRFTTNLGATDLVAHWNRCIDLVQDEEWIWFFSDDDLMDLSCVELLYKHIHTNPHHTFLHFNIQIIDENNQRLYQIEQFKPYVTAMEFFTKRLSSTLKSCAVEYIFRKDCFEAVNRFESFDLAWASDDATWIKLSTPDGIHTIPGAFVHWRQSSLNISPQSDRSTVQRKLSATIQYIQWAKRFFADNQIKDASTDFDRASYPTRVLVYTDSLSFREKYSLLDLTINHLDAGRAKPKLIGFWLVLEVKEWLKRIVNRG